MRTNSTRRPTRQRAPVAKPLLEALESRILYSLFSKMPAFSVIPHAHQVKQRAIHTTVAPHILAAPTADAPNPDSNTSNTAPAPTSAGTSATVVGRYIYYGATPYFGDVLASDKSVLLPNNTATDANVTSYTGGINELALDVSNAAASYSAGDFTFRVGQSGDPYSWNPAPAPSAITVTAGAGIGGSTRVYVRWNSGAIYNEWLQVIFNPAGDTFYVGNLIGDTGNLQVAASTETTVRANSTSLLSPAAITNVYDFNRDGKVDAIDQLVARAAAGTSLTPLVAPPVPAPPPAYDWHTQTINGVLNIWAPNPGDFGSAFAVTDPTLLFGPTGAPNIAAVHQGPIADCYFLSAAGAIAFSNPSRIEALVQNDPTGGWAVTFQYWNNTTYVPVVIHTDDKLSSALQTVSDNQVWPLVLEKAYAAFRTWNGATSLNTMASLGWGFGGTALLALNDPIQNVYIGSMTNQAVYAALQADLAARTPILFQTSSVAPDMVQSHVYTITGVSTDANGVQWVTTYNPWGFYDTRTETDLLANGIGTLTIGTY